MPSPLDVAIELEGVATQLPALAKIALGKAALDLISDFTDNSPVASGDFRGDWDYKFEPLTPGTVASVSIFNRKPYAAVIEEGSPKGGSPWGSAGPKTVEKDGRIWSKQAVGGVAAPILGENGGFADSLQHTINQFVFGGL